MSKLQQIFEEQANVIFNDSKYKFTSYIEKHSTETYACQSHNKILHLKAANLRSALFGMHNLSIGIKSGHLTEFLGKHEPRFAWRPLSIVKNREIAINSDISLFVPDLTKTGWDELCLRTIELGFNSLLFPISESKREFLFNQNIGNIFKTIHEYGLKIIVQPKFKSSTFAPFEAFYANFLTQHFKFLEETYPEIDGYFLESQAVLSEINNPNLFRNVTQQDLIEAEIKLLESSIGLKKYLFFYISAPNYEKAKQQAKWISQVSDNVGKNTVLAFSSVAGDHFSDHLSGHPFWDVLRKLPDVSATPLMPLINVGGLNLGEGLWPNLTIDLIDEYLSRCYRHSFAGAIVQIAHMPKQGALLDGLLWTTSQYLWKEKPAHLLLETWFLARRPELNIFSYRKFLNEVRDIVKLLSKIKCEVPNTNIEGKALAEYLLGHLSYLQVVFDSEKQKPSHPKLSWSDYFKPFARDARNLIYHYMLQNQITIPTLRREENLDLGFWTKNGSHLKILLDEPLAEFEEKNKMRKIFEENRLEF